jgi:hypothetical protein
MWAATPLASAASCGEVLNDWPITDTLGAALSCCTISQTIPVPSSRLPASITANVSMKASRTRSMASGGRVAVPNPVTKSAMVSLSRLAAASSALGWDFVSCASADCPARVSALAPPRNSRRSIVLSIGEVSCCEVMRSSHQSGLSIYFTSSCGATHLCGAPRRMAACSAVPAAILRDDRPGGGLLRMRSVRWQTLDRQNP